jgi:hypothetical protein
LLYLAFCLSTARLLAAARPKGTAGSEQRQDTDLTSRPPICHLPSEAARRPSCCGVPGPAGPRGR